MAHKDRVTEEIKLGGQWLVALTVAFLAVGGGTLSLIATEYPVRRFLMFTGIVLSLIVVGAMAGIVIFVTKKLTELERQ